MVLIARVVRQVEALARKTLKRPLEIVIGGKSVVCSDVKQIIEVRAPETKFRRLLELVEEWYNSSSILVFVEKQESCDELYRRLMQAGYRALSLHGRMDQLDRESTISDFKKGEVPLMVGTSLIARGLDVPNLNLVVNYDPPNHYEDYVHRVGRTGRAGRKGFAYTFLTPDEEQYAPDLVTGLQLAHEEVPPELLQLAEAYKQKRTTGAQVKVHGGGFGGKGFKFDATEEAKRLKQKKLERLAYGVEEEAEDDEDDIVVSTGTDVQTTVAAGKGGSAQGGAGGTAGAAAEVCTY